MARTHERGGEMIMLGPTCFLLALFWALTAFYGVIASQSFIQQQFLTPQLFAPLTFFAGWHTAIGVGVLVAWALPRLIREDGITPRVIAATTTSLAAIILTATIAPLNSVQTASTSTAIIAAGVLSLIALSVSEWRTPEDADRGDEAIDRSLADLAACLLAGVAATLMQSAATAMAGGSASLPGMLQSVRLHLLLGAVAFLCMTALRGLSEMMPGRRVRTERLLAAVSLSAAFAAFLFVIVLASISIRGPVAAAIAVSLALSVTFAAVARAGQATSSDDGISTALASMSPRLTREWWGLAAWFVVLCAIATGFAMASRTADWNFVVARTGVVLVWVLTLAGATAATRRIRRGGFALSTAVAAALLGAHLVMPAAEPVVLASAEPGTKWVGEMLEPEMAPAGGAEIVSLLHARTNIPRSTPVQPVDVSLAPLAGEPAAQRPHIFVFVVDSLRRDYLSPYNPAVTFTPSIGELAKDSLVFRNAFTQYGATGLSVPALWVGGPILHKQYVSPFAPMNSLAKLLEHERYAQWVGMDNIMDAILSPSSYRDRLDVGVAVKDFRLCRTLTDVRARLRANASGEPVFVYSLPQDVHVSVVAREGTRAIDDRPYGDFYAPVASRLSRLDACLGEFVAELKATGLYDQSVIVLTSDHGDSLGEEGRMGHAYSLHPEIVRVPLIVHVPPALRSQWTWDENRVTYTTDITPTLYRLLGHETQAPAGFFGEPLARTMDASRTAPRDRMIAASYGAVYGAVLNGGTQYYVFDAIAMRELAFSIGTGPEPGRAIPVTAAIQQRGIAVIRGTVDDISRFYRFPASSAAE